MDLTRDAGGEVWPSDDRSEPYQCDCCGRPNVPQKLKGIGYVCEDCLPSYTWPYGRYPGEEEPPKHWPVCPFRAEAAQLSVGGQ